MSCNISNDLASLKRITDLVLKKKNSGILLARFTHPNDRGIIEVTREQLDIDSCGHEHELEVSPPQEKALQHTQEKVSMDVPLMNLINNQNVVPREGRVRTKLAQKETLRGSLDYAI